MSGRTSAKGDAERESVLMQHCLGLASRGYHNID